MNLQEYRKLYKESDYFDKPSKELAEAWLDAKIETLDHLNRIYRNQNYNLVWGDLDKESGNFPNEVSICGLVSTIFDSIHIYNGIEKLAELLETDLENDGERLSFQYKGRKVFQISKEYEE